jgi:hypothetical protein
MSERDSSAVEGHNSSYRKGINTISKVVIDKIFTLLTFVMGLLEHGLPYDCPVICLYIHPSPS